MITEKQYLIAYFRDVMQVNGFPVALIRRHECLVRKDWNALRLYDKKADVAFVREMVDDLSSTLETNPEFLRSLLEAENNLRAEEIDSTTSEGRTRVEEIIRSLS